MKTLIALTFILSNLFVFGQEEFVVDFDPVGGKFEKAVTITLTADEEATIYYTTNGAVPNSSSLKYKAPIEIPLVGVIRAVAYKNGKRSEVNTQSYFCDRSYSLPIVSITTNPGNLWDYSTGIYVKGCCADTIEPYVGANFWKDWEKYANIEMYETNGDLCFNQPVGINLFGGFSRMLPQKSLAIFARSKYGKKRIEYPIFPDRKTKKYKSFIIRNSGGDFRRTHFRDAFMTQLAAPTGVAIQAYRPVVIFLNGEYWGIQNLREKISEHYLKANYGVQDKDNLDILRHNGVVRHGTSANYKKLLRFLRTKDLSNDAVIEELKGFMDVADYMRYNIAETYSDNRDAGGNIRYWRERNDSAKWRWVFYDLDLGLGNNKPTGYKHNTVKKFTSANAEAWPDPSWSTFIIRSLLKNKKMQTLYINTFADHLNTVYKEEVAIALMEKMKLGLKEEMHFHVKKWKTSYENWEYHIDIMREFVKERPKYLREFIAKKFDLNGTHNLQIKFPGKEKAKIKFNSLRIEADFEGIYFNDVPVTITVIPKHNYRFVGWSGRDEKTETITVKTTTDLILEPLFEPKEKSLWTDSLIFNEISMFQIKGDTSGDWIELYNHSATAIDIGNWRFTESNYKKGWVIPEATVLAAKTHLILAENKDNYATNYNIDTIQVIGDFEFGLSNQSEHLSLYDEKGLIVDSMTYHYENWDTLISANLIHPDSVRFNPNNWKLETITPGEISQAYSDYLQLQADKRRWTKIYYIGGGSFFFILVGGILWFRSSKKKKSKKDSVN